MPAVYRTALMPYSPLQMYDIVNDVERYPEFLPWCAEGKLLSHSETALEASIHMKKGRLNQRFSTRNTMQPGATINIDLIDGPFKKLTGTWNFHSVADKGCKIELRMEFEFSSRIISKLIGPVFTQIANSLVDAFCQRAHQIYRHAD